MSYELALLDVDGTLRTRNRWNPGALELIGDLHDAGLHVALCSGRPTGSMIELVQEHPEIEYLASCSGGAVLRRNGSTWDVIDHSLLPADAVHRALDVADELGIEPWCFTANEWLIDSDTEGASQETRAVGDAPRITDLRAEADTVAKVLFLLPEPKAAGPIRERLDVPGTALVMSGARHLDLVTEEAHRDKGGDHIRRALGVEWERVVAMGDGENDKGMLSHAGAAVCVAPLTDGALTPSQSAQRYNVDDTAAGRDAIRRVLGL